MLELSKEEELWKLWDSAPLSVIIVDKDGCIQYANPETHTTFGYSSGELVGSPLDILMPPSTMQLHQQHLQDFFQHPRVRSMTQLQHLLGQRKNGDLFPVEIGLSSIPINNKLLAIALIKDTSDRKQIEAYAQQLMERNSDLQAFTNLVAHDLKNPLTQIIGFSETLYLRFDTIPPEQIKYYLNMISEIGRRASHIVDEILFLSSLEQENIPRHVINMADIIEDVLADAKETLQDHDIHVVQPSEWPSAYGYAPWLERVWTNFIQNAIKYGGDGLHIQLGAKEWTDGQTCFWIEDDGPGIDPEKLDHLFDQYTRGDNVKAKGYGLGLSMVHRIIQKLDGEVGAENLPDQGCRFYFTLPITYSPSQPA